MEAIRDIFTGKANRIQENEIKTIEIDWNEHSLGILRIAKYLQPNFQITENNKIIMKLLLMYFTGNEDFKKEVEAHTGIEGSLNKGLYVVGSVGSGKTLLFKIFQMYTRDVINENGYRFQQGKNGVPEKTYTG